MRVVSFTPWLLYPWGKSSRYPSNRRSGRGVSAGNQTTIVQPVAYVTILTELTRLAAIFSGIGYKGRDLQSS